MGLFPENNDRYKGTLKELVPQEINDSVLAYPAEVRNLYPDGPTIPNEFTTNSRNPYCKLQSDWFYEGLDSSILEPKEGIDKQKALRHLSAMQRTFETPHEFKSAAVAYLMSLWFDIKEE